MSNSAAAFKPVANRPSSEAFRNSVNRANPLNVNPLQEIPRADATCVVSLYEVNARCVVACDVASVESVTVATHDAPLVNQA